MTRRNRTDEEEINAVTDKLLGQFRVGTRVRAGKKRRTGVIIKVYNELTFRVKFDEPLPGAQEAGHAMIGRDHLEHL